MPPLNANTTAASAATVRVTVNGSLETVNGAIFVDRGGKVKSGVETVNGSIGLVAAQLGGDIETVNGDITVGIDSVVKGGIKVNRPSFGISLTAPRKPRIVIGPNAVVEGPLVFEREVVLLVHDSARIGPVTGATPQRFDSETAPR